MITNRSATRAAAQGRLIVTIDSTRTPEDSFKLTPALLGLLQGDIDAMESGDHGVHEAEGDRASASGTVRDAFGKLEAALRTGYTGIGAIIGKDISATGISDAERSGVYATYGWEKQQLGRLTQSRLLILGELAVAGQTTIVESAWRYAPAIVTAIEQQLDIIDEEEIQAGGGDRQVSVAQRAEILDRLETRLARVRFHYCSASDDLDATKELARIGFQPRRPKGSVDVPPPAPVVTPVPPAP
jgi:hypothetical protein